MNPAAATELADISTCVQAGFKHSYAVTIKDTLTTVVYLLNLKVLQSAAAVDHSAYDYAGENA